MVMMVMVIVMVIITAIKTVIFLLFLVVVGFDCFEEAQRKLRTATSGEPGKWI